MEFFSEKMNKNGATNTINKPNAETHLNFRKNFIFFLRENSIRKTMKYTPNKNKQKIRLSSIINYFPSLKVSKNINRLLR